MADNSAIEWTDATWNPLRGCTRASTGCINCYAERFATRFTKPGEAFEGLAKMTPAGPRWTGEIMFVDHALDQPLRWRRGRKIFVNSVSDLFHEKVTDEQIDKIFAVMALARQHTFIVVTKRAARMSNYANNPETPRRIGAIVFANALRGAGTVDAEKWRHHEDRPWPLPNLWLLVSTENQETADERVQHLLATPAAKRGVSAEPLLTAIDMRRYLRVRDDNLDAAFRAGAGDHPGCGMARHAAQSGLHWVIVGGESGPGARPMQVEWARSLRDQCQAARVAFFFKQFGEHAPTSEHRDGKVFMSRVGKKAAGRLLDGREWSEFPQ